MFIHAVFAGSSTTAFVDKNGEEATVRRHNDCELFLQPEDLCCSICTAFKHTLSSKASQSKNQ